MSDKTRNSNGKLQRSPLCASTEQVMVTARERGSDIKKQPDWPPSAVTLYGHGLISSKGTGKSWVVVIG